MHALDHKLMRDFRRLWAQALAIALVLGCGVAIQLTTSGMSSALDATRTAYYEGNRFADVFATARRAPRNLLPDIQAIDGVWAAEARVTGMAMLDLPDRVRPAVGQVLSLPANSTARLNLPLLRSGRLPDPESSHEIVVNEPFARANGFSPGDTIAATLNGSRRNLTITGTVLSPEFIYTLGPGSIMPDNATFGILWMPERAAAAAFDMTGAFNSLSLKLSRHAHLPEVIDQLDAILAPYGGMGAHGRDLQLSHQFIDAEIKQLEVTALILPPVFFGITAFLVNMVIGRIVALERGQIGLLKAIGYSDWTICLHYLMLAGLIALVGIGAGWGAGSWLARALARLYAQFFDFPYLIYSIGLRVYAVSALVALLAATLGAVRAALAAARLSPAVAMSPPAPVVFRHGLSDRVAAFLQLGQPAMMVLRSLLRWPFRSGLSALGMALAVAVLVASGFFTDALDEIVDTTFQRASRQDMTLIFSKDLPESVLADIENLPGVLQTEGMQAHPVILRNGHLSKRVAIEARRSGADLSRVLDTAGRVVDPPEDGLLLSERLAEALAAKPGDLITVEFLTGRRETHEMRVAGTVQQYMGLGAYMDLRTAARILDQSPRISAAHVTHDTNQTDVLLARLKALPALSGTTLMTEVRTIFRETLRENVRIMSVVYISIAMLITVGVAYNGARILLSERARELASLRILGFTRTEVSFILVGEIMAIAVLAQPLGWGLGALIAWALSEASTSDLYSVPLVLTPANFASASVVVLAAAFLTALVVRRRIDRLDLVEVMKTRE